MAMNLQVDDQKKVKLAGEINTYHTELTNRIGKLNDVVDRIQAGWQGAASKEFDVLQRGVNENLKKIKDRLVDLEDAMRMSVQGFNAEEEQRIAEIRKVNNSSILNI
ncbi:WXG100 family type VII secretion target [Streptomyces bambusae]|uniref:ESAT-6-like protein n=1 Tax=Streptomyces bambusae TaxID=1550616 RepID=A0ABS6Z8X4_9ACTN|nr:WXG100 family type VII secretion target [Streptomyces bambusae]MBW5483171.1 WXG100 family type VII secretion target [Streptomyces bambusae]